MFDIGFTELLLVALIGLLVIGPEQLPGTLRTASHWWRTIQKSFAEIRASLEEEIGVDEIQAQLREDAIVADFKKHAGQLEALDHGASEAHLDLLDSFPFTEEKPVTGNKP